MDAERLDFDTAADELYGGRRDEFTSARANLAARAREHGDRHLADRITALRKPTVAAWLLNQLIRTTPSTRTDIANLAAELRAAHTELDGMRLRELTHGRTELLRELSGRIRQLAKATGQQLTETTARAVEDTLTAAIGDPEALAELSLARLANPITTDGLGGLALVPGTPQPAPEKKPGRQTSSSKWLVEERRNRTEQVRIAKRDRDEAERIAAEAEALLAKHTREIDELRSQLRTAEQAERTARKAATANRKKVEWANRWVEHAEQQLAELPSD